MMFRDWAYNNLKSTCTNSFRYIVRGSRGDFNLPGAVWQDLHADVWKEWLIDPAPTEWSDSGRLNYRDLPIFYVVVNFNVINITALNAPIRQIPMTQHSQQVKWSQIAFVGSIFLHTFPPGLVSIVRGQNISQTLLSI